MTRALRHGWIGLGIACALVALAALVASSVQAGVFNDPVQDCDPDPGNPTSGRYYQNGQPGEVNNIVTGYRRDGVEDGVISENRGTDSEGDPVNKTIICNTDELRWRLYLSNAGDRADTIRIDAVGLEAKGYGPLPPRIEARLSGGAGPDTLLGHDGKNTIRGGKGGDELQAFGRRDVLVGGPATDLMVAGEGRDLVRARDGALDEIRCGPDEDVAKADRRDDVFGCETVLLP